MALTAWKTWASGDTLTAADMNTYVRDNGRWLSGNATGGSPQCRVYNSANINISGSTDETLTFNSERYDVGAMHSTTTNTGRLTVPTGGAGMYLVFAHVVWGAFSDSTIRRIRIFGNGTTPLASVANPAISTAAVNTAQTIVTIAANQTATDYFTVVVFQGSASGLGLDIQSSANQSPEFGAVWLSE
jgi:hypothetical protein